MSKKKSTSKTNREKKSKVSVDKTKKSAKPIKLFHELLKDRLISDNEIDVTLVNKGQYKEAFELLEDAEACQLTPMLIGPPGTGKTMLARSFSISRNREFEWMTMDESTKPVHLTGAFDPAETIRRGFTIETFVPGPLVSMMVHGGCFLANELNRATEYTQNSFLEPLEERSFRIPQIGRIKAREDFFLIAAANPGDLAGTHRISEALKDRIKVWIKLDYPSKSVEMEIIRANVPQSQLSNDFFELTHDIIVATRKTREIERPASIRSAIALVKLAGHREKLNSDLSIKDFSKLAKKVLVGGIKSRPGYDEETLVKKVVDGVVRA